MKKNILSIALLSLFSVALTSCKEKEETSTTIEETIDYNDYSSYEIKSPSYDVPKRNNKNEVTYLDLFNLGNKITIRVDIKDSELQKLEEDYLEFERTGIKGEIYRHCDSVTITMVNYDKTFSWEFLDVGIRQKGNTSRGHVYENGTISRLNHFKLSFDETFDSEEYGADKVSWVGREEEYTLRKNRDFLGLSGIDLRSNAQKDSSYIREIYASYMYRASGLLTQYIGLSKFNIFQSDQKKNNKMGVYKIYEPTTKSMIKRHLTDEDLYNFGSYNDEKNGAYGANAKYGDLYKAKWSGDLSFNGMYGNLVGVKDILKGVYPTYERKTNKDIEYDDHLLKLAGIAVSYGNYADIDKYVDLKYFAKTEAVSWFLGNPDDLRNNVNNTMYYAKKIDGKVISIPIDNDRVLGLTYGWNPDKEGCSKRDIFDLERAGYENTQVSDIYKKTILAEDTNLSKIVYLNHIRALAKSLWVENDTFNEYYNLAKKNYSNSVKSDFHYVEFEENNTYNDFTFSEYVTEKLKHVDFDLDLGEIKNIGETKDLPTLEDFNGYYGELYICGDMNMWKGTSFPMEYLGDGVYTITFMPFMDSNALYLKIYDGEYWRINWSIKDGKLLMYDTDAIYISNPSSKLVLTITINTITKEAKIKRSYQSST